MSSRDESWSASRGSESGEDGRRHLRALFATWREVMGNTTREERMLYASRVLGRHVFTWRDLSPEEARAIITALRKEETTMPRERRNTVEIRERGGRIYVRGRTFPVRGLLREYGLEFDNREGHWWGTLEAPLDELMEALENAGVEVVMRGKAEEAREERATGGARHLPSMLQDDDFWFLVADVLTELRSLIREMRERSRKEGGNG
jgi:hypothetical protein